ncbi:NAD metabolism ATPase/kinase-like protein [uncultured Paludibacter sp.]|nr:NAD metabolism ATPase/kinase-like protein [uncultured Paludibacter sp.]
MLKIAIIGPESTGKTELTERLAKHFHTVWEPELAREYVENLRRDYTFDDVCKIAKQQIEIEKRYDQNNYQHKIVFFDTDLIITKVWLEYKYKQVPDFVTERLKEKFIDFYLLLEPDIAWQPDPVREHGNDRDYFFNWYKQEIENLNIPYSIINGLNEKRFQNALKAIKKRFKNI